MKFSLLYENTIWVFLFLETWPYAWKQKHDFFLMFWRKPGILIPDVYFYDVKIQINIKQNLVEKYAGELQIFENNFFEFFFGTGLDRARPNPLILDWAGLVRPSEQWSTLHCSCRIVETVQRGRRRKRKRGGPAVASRLCCWRLLTGERLGRWSAFLLLLCVFFSSALFSSVSVFSVFLLLFLTVQGLLSMTGRMVAAGDGSGVALVAAMLTAAGGSSSFLSFFVFTSKTWQWRWWCCCCSSCPCRGACFFFLFTGVTSRRGRWWEAGGGAAPNGGERGAAAGNPKILPCFCFFPSCFPLFSKNLPPLYFLSSVLFLLSLLFFSVILLFYFASVFYSFLPSLVSLHSLSLLFLYFWTMMVLSVVAGRSDGGAGGGAMVALLLPLRSCSFTLLSPFSSFFFCFARAPLLSNKLPPVFCSPSSVFCSSPKFCPPVRSSLSQKKSSPLLFSVLSPVFIGSRGRGSPYPVQVQGMVAWELQGMFV